MEMCQPDAIEDDLTNTVVKIRFYSELVHNVVRLEMLGGLLKTDSQTEEKAIQQTFTQKALLF